MMEFISVVVCTYNRARLLKSCLDSLAIQMLDPDLFEVLIVVNNSTDDSLQIATEYVAVNPHFRVIVEPVQGLSYARNRGYKEASGQYVAYIDDDAVAHSDWLVQMFSFLKQHPNVEAFGGPYKAIFATTPPKWFPPEYGSLSLGDKERPIDVGKEFISGTNMVFRRMLLKAMGGFNTALGMRGGQLAYGEETRLLLGIAKRGVDIYYLPNMSVDHLVAEYKISLRWLLLSAYANGRCSVVIFNQQRNFGSHLMGICVGVGKMILRMFISGEVPFKRKLYYSLAGFCAEIGAFTAYLSAKSSIQ